MVTYHFSPLLQVKGPILFFMFINGIGLRISTISKSEALLIIPERQSQFAVKKTCPLSILEWPWKIHPVVWNQQQNTSHSLSTCLTNTTWFPLRITVCFQYRVSENTSGQFYSYVASVTISSLMWPSYIYEITGRARHKALWVLAVFTLVQMRYCWQYTSLWRSVWWRERHKISAIQELESLQKVFTS